MTVQGQKDLTGKMCYVYILNLMAKPSNLPKCIMDANASNAPSCNIHARDNALSRMGPESQKNTLSAKQEDKRLISAVH